tara:strand:- start:158 stop:433 length:276 start_codon:yes stop_codon:yes gene_type:complete
MDQCVGVPSAYIKIGVILVFLNQVGTDLRDAVVGATLDKPVNRSGIRYTIAAPPPFTFGEQPDATVDRDPGPIGVMSLSKMIPRAARSLFP